MINDLNHLSDQLVRIQAQLTDLLPKLQELEAAYYYAYNKYLLTSQLKTATDREAEAKVRLYDEGISEPYKRLKADVQVLMMRRETKIEICKNMRADKVA